MRFDPSILTPEDRELAAEYLGPQRLVSNAGKISFVNSTRLETPDEIIAADGQGDYLYRWYVTPKRPEGLCYLHVQVADDPDRGLHDHPWDNQSVILSGGYVEQLQVTPPNGYIETLKRKKGDVIHRRGFMAHRLLLAPGVPYTMTLFSTGPRERDWGFWVDRNGVRKWYDFRDVTLMVDGEHGPRSTWTGPRDQ